jgi:hypothetical protein
MGRGVSFMKVTTVREMIDANGTKTTITIEDNLSDADLNQLDRHLEVVGFYESQSLGIKVKRMIMGK